MNRTNKEHFQTVNRAPRVFFEDASLLHLSEICGQGCKFCLRLPIVDESLGGDEVRMLFYRGITVPEARAEEIIREIRTNGMMSQPGTWQSDHYKPDPSLIDLPDLKIEHTRPKGLGTPVLYACGNRAGAHYYAALHNRTKENDTPVVIHFESDIANVAVDGRDFLYTILQLGDPDRARPIVRDVFGAKGLWYAERAWQEIDQNRRIAIGDLMIHDPEVIEWHYASNVPIHGRHNTRFTNAFTVGLPIPASAIREVKILDEVEMFSGKFVSLDDVRKL